MQVTEDACMGFFIFAATAFTAASIFPLTASLPMWTISESIPAAVSSFAISERAVKVHPFSFLLPLSIKTFISFYPPVVWFGYVLISVVSLSLVLPASAARRKADGCIDGSHRWSAYCRIRRISAVLQTSLSQIRALPSTTSQMTQGTSVLLSTIRV